MKSTSFDVIIVGAGAAGLAAAVSLARQNHSVCLIDKASAKDLSDIKKDGRTSGLWLNSIRFLEDLGVWETLEPTSQPIERLVIKDGDLEIPFSGVEIGEAALGYNLVNANLRAALLQAAKNLPTLTMWLDTPITAIENGPFVSTVTTAKDTLTARLLVGADGRASPTREAAGIALSHHDYNQDALVLSLSHENAHDNTSFEHYYEGGPFTLVPMSGNTSSLVWVDWRPDIDRLMSISDAALLSLIHEKSRGILGECHLTSARFRYPLVRQKATAITAPRLVLLGEAAHAIHPIGAQGLNLSFRDVQTLSTLLEDASDCGDASLLQRYRAKRAVDMGVRIGVSDGLVKMVTAYPQFVTKLRRGSLKALDTCTPVKKLLLNLGLAA